MRTQELTNLVKRTISNVDDRFQARRHLGRFKNFTAPTFIGVSGGIVLGGASQETAANLFNISSDRELFAAIWIVTAAICVGILTREIVGKHKRIQDLQIENLELTNELLRSQLANRANKDEVIP